MKVKFWGVRGSIPTPGPSTAIYGGNTSCYEVEDDDGNIFIFDAGTGIRECGQSLAARQVKEIHLFISHTHWDHIQGFPFFVPSYIPGVKINIYGPTHFEKSLRKIMDLQMDYAYFPISRQQLNAEIDFKDLKEETIKIGNTEIITKYSNHPVTSLCYKIVSNGKTVVYSGDNEPYYNVLVNEGDDDDSEDDDFEDGIEDEDMDAIVAERNQLHRDFCKSDLLIHDAQYTVAEYPKFKGWGHSPMELVIAFSKVQRVKKLFLTHHEPTRNDEAMEEIEKRLQAANEGFDLQFTREGMEVEV